MSEKLYPGTSYWETLTFSAPDPETGLDVEYDPDSVTVEFLSPNGTIVDTLSLSDLKRLREGVYDLTWLLPADAEKGTWTRRVVAASGDGMVRQNEEPFNVSTQPYGTLSVVKRLCRLSDEDSQDRDLMSCLDDATDWINLALKRAGEKSLPLTVVLSAVASISCYYAAGLFLQREKTDENSSIYVKIAEQMLDVFLQANYYRACVRMV